MAVFYRYDYTEITKNIHPWGTVLMDRFLTPCLPTACQIGAVQNYYQHLAKKVQSKSVTSSLPKRCGLKLLPAACQKGLVSNCYQQLAR